MSTRIARARHDVGRVHCRSGLCRALWENVFKYNIVGYSRGIRFKHIRVHTVVPGWVIALSNIQQRAVKYISPDQPIKNLQQLDI